MRLILFCLFWFLYFPLLKLLGILLFWHPKVKERSQFEKRNKFEYLAQSFKEWKEKADICFEFSSEGEYQQVASLIDDVLKEGKKVELVFFSPSVERTIMALAAKYPRQIRYLRYPLVRFMPFIKRRSFSHWATASVLVLVRYDFLPEFLLWSTVKSHKLRLVWITFKKERSLGRKVSLWKKLFLKQSEKIVFARNEDLLEGEQLGVQGHSFDFRIEQIRRRNSLREVKLQEEFKLHQDLLNHWNKPSRRLIMGNAWPEDLFLLKDFPEDILVVIVPHNLDSKTLEKFDSRLLELRKSYILVEEGKSLEEGSTYLINKKGVLCELYPDFTHAYIGGGFGESIHSVLEPLVGGVLRISCGPKHFRSTEYDICKELGRIEEVSTSEDFLRWYNEVYDESSMELKSILSDSQKLQEYITLC